MLAPGKARRTSRLTSAVAALFLAAVVGLALAIAGPAYADGVIDRAALALQTSPVYNDPAAENALSAGDADRVLSDVQAAGKALNGLTSQRFRPNRLRPFWPHFMENSKSRSVSDVLFLKIGPLMEKSSHHRLPPPMPFMFKR